MANKQKHLNAKGKGEFHYNYKQDILFFKIKDREYQRSLDFGDIILDIDKEGYITGVQIFDASNIFRIDRLTLRNIKNWEFSAKSENNVVTLQIMFVIVRRNKMIVERGENLVREAGSQLKDTEVLCTIPPSRVNK